MRSSILVVDDEPAVISMLKTVLETYGYTVSTAANAAEATTILSNAAFDLVITDMRMETDIAGYDVVRAAAARPEQPVIVILTAFPLLAQQWREAGAHAALAKPARMAELLETVGELLARRRTARR